MKWLDCDGYFRLPQSSSTKNLILLLYFSFSYLCLSNVEWSLNTKYVRWMKQRGLPNCCKPYCKCKKKNIRTKLRKGESWERREREREREKHIWYNMERNIYFIILTYKSCKADDVFLETDEKVKWLCF